MAGISSNVFVAPNQRGEKMNMEEVIANHPSWSAICTLTLACSLCAGSLTWVIKGSKIGKTYGGSWFLRLASVVFGAGAGLLLGGPQWGLTIGIGSGALATTVVAGIKRRIREKS